MYTLLAAAQEIVDTASQAERLGLIGVLAAIAVGFGWVLWRIYNKTIADKDATITRLLEERNAAHKRERDLHAYIDDIVVPLVTEASRGVSRTMRRVLDDE